MHPGKSPSRTPKVPAQSPDGTRRVSFSGTSFAEHPTEESSWASEDSCPAKVEAGLTSGEPGAEQVHHVSYIELAVYSDDGPPKHLRSRDSGGEDSDEDLRGQSTQVQAKPSKEPARACSRRKLGIPTPPLPTNKQAGKQQAPVPG